MKIEIFKDRLMDVNCYRIAQQGVAIIIDPCVVMKDVLKGVEPKEVHVFLTHGHFDHFQELASYIHKNVVFYMHKEALVKLKDPAKNYSTFGIKELTFDLADEKVVVLKDQQALEIPPFSKWMVYWTPGHTNCSVTFAWENHLFTGDTLFQGSIGRTDLYSANTVQMMDSLKRLQRLPSDSIVYPGHGKSTTLEIEIKSNIYMNRGV